MWLYECRMVTQEINGSVVLEWTTIIWWWQTHQTRLFYIKQFPPNVFKMLFLSANQLPAGLITTDGQQQNVMVYTTSYQQVWCCILSPTLPSAAKIQTLVQMLCSEKCKLILFSPLVAVIPLQHWELMAACC